MPDETPIEKECIALCRYLIGKDPPGYVVRKYTEAHAPGRCGPGAAEGGSEEALVALARRGPPFVRLADTYAAVFSRGGTLRRKLVLLLAILESFGDTSPSVDSPTPGSARSLALGLALRAGAFLVTLLAALAVVTCWRGVRAVGGNR